MKGIEIEKDRLELGVRQEKETIFMVVSFRGCKYSKYIIAYHKAVDINKYW